MTVFCVTKSAPELVRPSEATPCANLSLSFLDRVPGLRLLIATVFVYRHGEDAAGVIRDALSKTLVYYYPVAGRIVDSGEDGEPEVACTGEGAWFVEASANCSLEDVNFLQLPLMIPKEQLLPFPPPKVDEKDLILLLQVTKFTCGGFAVGLRSSHTMFDGVGQAQFLKAVGEISRGLDKPLVQPIWCREAIPSPPKSKPLLGPPPPPAVSYKFESFILDVPIEFLNRIKNRFMEEMGQRCSTFDIMTAKTWQCRTQAMALDLHEEHVHLGFAVNMRHLMDQYFAEVGGAGAGGYYGNCVHNMSLGAPSQRIARAPLTEVIGLVRDAKRRAAGEFARRVESGGIPEASMMPLGRGTMCVLDWSRVGFLEVDYGWGEPMHGVPLNDHHFIAWCIILKPLPPKQGARVVVNCVEQEHAAVFRDQMMRWE